MMMQLYRYDFDLVYKKEAELYIADTLSRAPRRDTNNESTTSEYEVMEVSQISDARQEELRKATLEDPTMQKLTDTIRRGWPQSEGSCAPEIRSFFPFRDELINDNGVIKKGHKYHSKTTAENICTAATSWTSWSRSNETPSTRHRVLDNDE